MTKIITNWSKSSYRNFPAAQQPDWPDTEKYEQVLNNISNLPPLVFAGEIRSLKSQLAEVAKGNAFLLQGGDCAEEFASCSAPSIRERLKVILQMAVVLTYAGEKSVVKVGRIAGQYAKPRSSDTEIVNGEEIKSYRGDAVNSPEPTVEARVPDCDRLQQMYHLSATTQNILRAFTKGGYAALEKIHVWNKEFIKSSPQGKRFEEIAINIDQALKFMKSIGLDTNAPRFREVDFYSSHEALLLGYEEALTRQDSTTGEWYDCSGHMIWIGERTRQLDGAHVEFFRGINNPIGVKIGPTFDPDEVKRLVSTLNPNNEFGRLTLITRLGVNNVAPKLPRLIKTIQEEGFNVVWCCDAMHANTYTSASGYKTRNFDDILNELQQFFNIHQAEGTVPGGMHFELTGADVTECIGGGDYIEDHQLPLKYLTNCDPRLNAKQSLELAFMIAERLKKN